MDTKYVIFVFISAFLVAAVYSSTATNTTHNLSADPIIGCFHIPGHDSSLEIVTCCDAELEGYGTNIHDAKCFPNKLCYTKKTLTCTEIGKGKPAIEPNVDVLKNNSMVEQNNENNDDNTTSNDNVKEPKAPKIPEGLGGLNDNGD